MQRRSMAFPSLLVKVLILRYRLEEEITDSDSPAIRDEFHAAVSLLADLEAELETVRIPRLLNPPT